jgi:hypothetical protein
MIRSLKVDVTKEDHPMTLHVLFWIQYIVPSHLGFPMNMGKKIIDDNRHKVMTIPIFFS